MSLSAAAFAQKIPHQKEENIIPHEINKVILEAATLSPEITVDIYLKIIASGKIKNKKAVKKLLEDAFYLTFQVNEKTSKKIISFDGQVLTIRQTFISNSKRNNLDSLSLQTGIVSEMLKIDSVRALELFKEISPNLYLKPLSCQDFLLPDTASFYGLVENISEIAFSNEQIKQGQRITFLASYVENMTSPTQISPIINMLLSIDLTNDEILNLAEVFNKSLKGISGDVRAFSYQMNFETLNRDIFQLYRKLMTNPSLSEELSRSYKQFLQKNLRGKRCRDNLEYETRNGKVISENEQNNTTVKVPLYVAEASKIFNYDLPLQNEDLSPSEIETIDFPTQYFTAGKSKEALKKIRNLQNWEEANKTYSEVREGQKWQEEFSKTLEFVLALKEAEDEESIDVFHQKCLLLRLLLVESPIISFKEKIVNEYLKLLNDKQIERDYTSEWFLQFDDLKQEILELKNTEEKLKLLNIMRNTNNSAISIYLKLEKEINTEKNS